MRIIFLTFFVFYSSMMFAETMGEAIESNLSKNFVIFDSNCNYGGSDFKSLFNFFDEMEAITEQTPGSTKVFSFKVKYDKSGFVSIKYDPVTKELLGVNIYYGGHNPYSFEELNEGKGFEYADSKYNNGKKILSLKLANAGSLSKTQGGKFTLSILINNNPIQYKDIDLYLRKNGNDWVIKNKNNQIVTNSTIVPETTLTFKWKGYFSSNVSLY